VKVSSISSEVGLAPRTTAKPTPKNADKPFLASAKVSAVIDWPDTVGVNFQISEKTFQEFKPLVNGLGLGLNFSIDRETGQRVITVYDLKTGAVIRQIPPEELLAVLRQVQRNNALSAGLFISRRL
jgi:flagellar protein FlaG